MPQILHTDAGVEIPTKRPCRTPPECSALRRLQGIKVSGTGMPFRGVEDSNPPNSFPRLARGSRNPSFLL